MNFGLATDMRTGRRKLRQQPGNGWASKREHRQELRPSKRFDVAVHHAPLVLASLSRISKCGATHGNAEYAMGTSVCTSRSPWAMKPKSETE